MKKFLHDAQCELLVIFERNPFSHQMFSTQSILIRWTKGFNCSGVEGEDVVKLLKDAIHRRGVSLKYSYDDLKEKEM